MDETRTLKPIPGLERYLAGSDGTIWTQKKAGLRQVSAWLRRDYLRLYLRPSRCVRKMYSVHRLIALAFHGEPQDGHEACHNNGDKLDNRADNLRWDTHYSNYLDSVKHRTAVIGTEKNRGHAGSGMGWPPGKLLKLTDDDIRAIFRLKSSMSQKMLAARFRVTTSLIHKLLHGGYSDVAYERCGIDASQINSTQYRDRRKQIA